MESGGTVLSTNWKDVGKRKVEMSPPDDVEFKKFWATHFPPSLSLSFHSFFALLDVCLCPSLPLIWVSISYPTVMLHWCVTPSRFLPYLRHQSILRTISAVAYEQMRSNHLNLFTSSNDWKPMDSKGNLSLDFSTTEDAPIQLSDMVLWYHSSFIFSLS